MEFTRPRGTRDFFPEEMEKRRWVEAKIRNTFENFGYGEILTPTFEHINLITAKSGEDIVEHLYTFVDRGKRKLVLRPELTAPVMRAYVNELQSQAKPVKLYYIANCFRYERPQSGRYREFWQAGIELIGSPGAEAEAEVIALAYTILKNLNLKDFTMHIGNIGLLRKFLKNLGITEQSNFLALIDKKEHDELEKQLKFYGVKTEDRKLFFKIINLKGNTRETVARVRELFQDREILKEMDRFEETLNYIDNLGVDYSVNFGIARGLDYYTGMVFEIYAQKLGAEKQICGGGSYSLTETFGGKATPTCGFAIGFDRLILALDKYGVKAGSDNGHGVYVIPVSQEFIAYAMKITSDIREYKACEMELKRRKLGKALSYASKKGFEYVVIVGEEIIDSKIILKNLISKEQVEIDISKMKTALTTGHR